MCVWQLKLFIPPQITTFHQLNWTSTKHHCKWMKVVLPKPKLNCQSNETVRNMNVSETAQPLSPRELKTKPQPKSILVLLLFLGLNTGWRVLGPSPTLKFKAYIRFPNTSRPTKSMTCSPARAKSPRPTRTRESEPLGAPTSMGRGKKEKPLISTTSIEEKGFSWSQFEVPLPLTSIVVVTNSIARQIFCQLQTGISVYFYSPQAQTRQMSSIFGQNLRKDTSDGQLNFRVNCFPWRMKVQNPCTWPNFWAVPTPPYLTM